MNELFLQTNPQFTESRKLYLKWRVCELISAIFSNLGIITSTIDYETGFASNRNHYNCAESSTEVLRWLTLALTLIAILFLVERHRIKVKWYNSRPEEPSHTQKEAEIKRKQIKKKKKVLSRQFFLEIFLLCLFPYPMMNANISLRTSEKQDKFAGIDMQVHLCYTLAECFYTLTFIRLIFLLRALFNFTPYQDDHARYYCARYRTKANVRFSIRCILKTRPFLMIVAFILPSFFILGIFLRVFERPYADISLLNFDSYLNAVWCCAVTMATIGYGDLYPGTLFGRIVAIICAMWGAFAFSMIVFTLETSLQLSQNQNKAFMAIVRSRAAAKAVATSLLYNVAKKRHGYGSRQAKKLMKKLQKRLNKFTNTVKQLSATFSIDKGEDKNKERFQKLSKHVMRIEEKLDRVLGLYD